MGYVQKHEQRKDIDRQILSTLSNLHTNYHFITFTNISLKVYHGP